MKPSVPGLYLRGRVYWWSRQQAGRRVFVSLETGDLATAIARIAEIRARPEVVPGFGWRGDVAAFLADRRRDGHYSRHTARSFQSALALFGRHHRRVAASEVTAVDCAAFLDGVRQRASAATFNAYRRAMRAFFSWAVENKLCAESPADGIAELVVRSKRSELFCSAAQRDALIAAAAGNPALEFILHCGFHAGLRKQEITQARRDWFDLDAGLLHVRKTPTFEPKTHKERVVPINATLLAFLKTSPLLAAAPTPDAFVLWPEIAHSDERLYRVYFHRDLAALAKQVGLTWVTPHILRHTFASLLASRGVSIFKIAAWLGDSLQVTLDHYARLEPADRDIDRLV